MSQQAALSLRGVRLAHRNCVLRCASVHVCVLRDFVSCSSFISRSADSSVAGVQPHHSAPLTVRLNVALTDTAFSLQLKPHRDRTS